MKKARPAVNTVEAKNRLNELIAEVNRSKEPIVVEKRGKPVAVVVDYESYSKGAGRSEKARDETLVQEIEAFQKVMKKKYPSGTGDTVEILRDVRLARAVR